MVSPYEGVLEKRQDVHPLWGDLGEHERNRSLLSNGCCQEPRVCGISMVGGRRETKTIICKESTVMLARKGGLFDDFCGLDNVHVFIGSQT